MKKLVLLFLLFAGTRLCAQVPTLDKSCLATTSTTQTFCTMSGVTAGDALVIHIHMNSAATLTSIQDCAGSSACSTTVDALTPSVACTVVQGSQICEYYTCLSGTSGTVSVTLNQSSATANFVEAEAWKGMIASGCLDQANTGGVSGLTTLTVNTPNVGYAGEITIGLVGSDHAPTTGSGFTQIQLSGGFQTQYNSTSPTINTASSSTWTFGAGAIARGLVSTWKGGIFHDADSNAGACGNNISCAWNHTTGTGPNRILIVYVTADTGFFPLTISSVTYGGNGMTAGQTANDTVNTSISTLYYLMNPPSGTNSIVVTLSHIPGTTNGIFANAMSFSGVYQVSLDNNGNNQFNAAATTMSTSLTTSNVGSWIVDGITSTSGGTVASNFVANSPQVKTSSFATGRVATSYQGPINTPGSTSDGWTDGGLTARLSLVTAAIRAASSAVVGVAGKNMMPVVM